MLTSTTKGEQNVFALFGNEETAPLVFSVVLATVFFADRTGIWLKEQKHFDGLNFTLLCLGALLYGLATVKRSDKDLGFLNRDQTDEWKGWMQGMSIF